MAGYALCVGSVFNWQSGVFPMQFLMQLSVIATLLWVGVRHWNRLVHSSRNRVVMLSDNGEWLYLDQESENNWQIGGRSRISNLLLWVELIPKIAGQNSRNSWLWIFRDQVTEQNYRRLCRVIIRQKQESSSRPL